MGPEGLAPELPRLPGSVRSPCSTAPGSLSLGFRGLVVSGLMINNKPVSQNAGIYIYIYFWGISMDRSILGSTLGSPYSGQLQYRNFCLCCLSVGKGAT